MPYVTAGQRNSAPIDIYHEGRERVPPLAGYRVITNRPANFRAFLDDFIAGLDVVTAHGGPPDIGWPRPEVVEPALLDFLAR
ncbi:hypothetical protein [Actinomadura sp. NPDC049753]|uniref:hypothetical protein n=1 Tax=Actinomadura sp. NPDC049753 TaxID=3154739 RepID=UPI0034354A75